MKHTFRSYTKSTCYFKQAILFQSYGKYFLRKLIILYRIAFQNHLLILMAAKVYNWILTVAITAEVMWKTLFILAANIDCKSEVPVSYR